MAKKMRLFRVSLAGDDETTGDRIDFNDGANPNVKDTDIENPFMLSIETIGTESIADQQGAEQDHADQEALGPVEDVYEITGFISKTDGDLGDGQNQFLILLDLWDKEPKTLDGVWEEGRFGIVDDNDHTNDLIPVNTGSNRIGLLWESYRKKQDLGRNRTEFTIRLRLNKGDGT